MRVEEIDAAGLWATVPLLDKSNIGKYVMTAWNGNWVRSAAPNEIVKVGRTNITLAGNISLRVGAHTAHSTGASYTSAWTREWFLQRERRSAIAQRLIRNVRFNDSMDLELLEAAAALFNIDISDIES